MDANSVIGTLYMKFATEIKDARVLCFAPPMIPGYSISNGFELNLQDKTGGSLDHFYEVAQNFLAELMKRPEIAIAGINVERKSCKKTYTTKNTKIKASIRVLITS